jgi:hypothetical protein
MRFLKLSDAAQKLGYANARSLRHAIHSGVLRLGYEVQDRRAKNASRPFYWVDIERSQQRFAQLPEKRK